MFDITNKISRLQFIKVFMISLVVAIVYSLILDPVKAGSTLGTVLGIGLILYTIFLFALWIIIAKQRANDISEKHAIIVFIILGLTPLFFLLAIIPGENKVNSTSLAK